MAKVIEFTVDGRPPKKSDANSLWSSTEAEYVLKLRESAFEAREKNGMKECFQGPVKLELTIFAPNIQKLAHDYVSDLDTMIAGVFESIQPAHPSAPNRIIFGKKPTIYPKIPLLIKDDSQIVYVKAEKKESQKNYYTIKIGPA